MSQAHDQPLGACPTGEELRSFLSGSGTSVDGDRQRLADHLSCCRQCMDRMENISFDNRVVSALRRVSELDSPSAAEMTEVTNQIQLMSRDSFGISLSGAMLNGGHDTSPPPFEVPSKLGHYRIVELLSSGGMGIVYRAEDTTLRRFVALKLLRPAVVRESGFRERFLKEAQTLAAVKHDNIVVIYQVGEAATPADETVPFLAMELLEGESLKTWMDAHPRPPAEWVIRIGRQAAAGLAAAHARNFIHRDVKPANLWLEAPSGWSAEPAERRQPLGAMGRVKLLDFGLARPTDEGVSRGVSGTPAYMAPEQARGERIDARSDLFGLGCVLYELCTGTLPFSGKRYPRNKNHSPAPQPILELNRETPVLLASLIERMLQPGPEARPASARKVEEELAALDTGIIAANTIDELNADTVSVPDRLPATSQRIRTSFTVAALAVIVAICFAAWQGRRPSDQQTPTLNPGSVTSGETDDPWARQIASENPKQQFTLVTDKLRELNPGLKVTDVSGWIEPELVVRVVIGSNSVVDISPIRGLPDVKMVGVVGRPPESGVFTDISPLAEMRLNFVRIAHQPRFKDLSPLKNLSLLILQVPYTGVESLADIRGNSLEELDISHTRVSDLSLLRSFANLKELDCTGCPIETLEPLAGTAIRELRADIRTEKDKEVLRRMPLLKRVNDKSANEFLSRP